jgi:hypothetical protein
MTAAVGLALVLPGAAHADPSGPRSDAFDLTCDGTTYAVAVAGNGLFTPAHDTDSTTVFVPTMFGETTVTVALAETGEVIDEFTDAPAAKGQAHRQRSTSMSCVYTTVFEFHDEELDEDLLVTVVGSVDGFSTPAAR